MRRPARVTAARSGLPVLPQPHRLGHPGGHHGVPFPSCGKAATRGTAAAQRRWPSSTAVSQAGSNKSFLRLPTSWDPEGRSVNVLVARGCRRAAGDTRTRAVDRSGPQRGGAGNDAPTPGLKNWRVRTHFMPTCSPGQRAPPRPESTPQGRQGSGTEPGRSVMTHLPQPCRRGVGTRRMGRSAATSPSPTPPATRHRFPICWTQGLRDDALLHYLSSTIRFRSDRCQPAASTAGR